MILGVGTDLFQVSRIEHSIERHGERFIKRILSKEELKGYMSSKRQANYLAKRFAVKEAVSKALGTGIAEGVTWHDIEVCYSDLGAPRVKLYRGAAKRLDMMNGSSVHISISDEADMVVAFAVIS